MKRFRVSPIVSASLVVGTALGSLIASASAADPIQPPKAGPSERQFLVQCVVSGSKDKKAPPLSRPYILVSENQEAKLLVGGTQVALPGTGTLESLDTGLSVQVKVSTLDANKVQLDLSLAMNDLKPGDKKKVTLIGRSVRDIEVVKLGEPVHLDLGDDPRSVEVTVTPVSPSR
jgi:hypothetical protein